ncbi:hypothetical protein IWX78_002111 [Mycetocola sp. CAN_C7]|uniref:phosphatase PAP2 family protein n=1 Tax=Mycetocola sp. CAN_C7 TaxID=2787724 RepID=UPI001A2CC0B9
MKQLPFTRRPDASQRIAVARSGATGRSRASRRRASGMVAAGTGLSILLSGAGAGAAVAAAPFPADDLTRSYPSNVSYRYELIMDSFTVLRDDEAIIAHNDATTIAINNSASPEQVDRAIVDQYADMSISMADAFGQNLGAFYTEGRLNGELPKVEALMAKEGGLIGYHSSSNPSKEFFSYDRPYIRIPELLQYRDKPDGDAWESTSGSFPSGHTSQAYWQGTAFAVMLPELAPQILARTSEASNNRIVMAAHYPLDVIGGRMMGNHILERRMTDSEFRPLIAAAASELRDYLETRCGDTIEVCIAEDTPYLNDEESLAVYEERMTYSFPRVAASGLPVSVPDDAESLLLTSHPDLTAEQRRRVLELTAIDSGYPLDQGNSIGGWQRINLAAAMAAEVVVAPDGSVSLADDAAPSPEPEPDPSDPGTSPDPSDPGNAPEPNAPGMPADVDGAMPTADDSAAADDLADTGADLPVSGLGAALMALVAGAALLVLRRRIARQ